MSDAIRVRIKRAAGNADVPLPRRMTDQAAGFDVAAVVPDPVTLKPGDIRLIPCGFHLGLPAGYEAQIRARSGLALKHGVTPVNSPGTIDADFRGEVHIPLINHGRESFTIERGMRIAQMVIVPVPMVVLEETASLDDTPRGQGGFGHTGQ